MQRVLILQTGGTLMMRPDPGEPDRVNVDPEAGARLLREVPDLERLADVDVLPLFNLDSSDVGPEHWMRIQAAVRQRYDAYDGFVVVHGTDTMAYTASALSFALRGLGKPVVLTGSQVPLAALRSDARRNLVNAVELATMPIPEVGIAFGDRLFRGNRATKTSIGDFDAFTSPNHPPLARIGLHIEVGACLAPDPAGMPPCAGFDPRVQVLHVFPGMPIAWWMRLAEADVRAVVVQGFGSGNVPVRGASDLRPVFAACREAGIPVVMTSHAAYDSVDLDTYANGRAARDLGVLSGGDLTLEAALVKTMYLLAHPHLPFAETFLASIAGERNPI